MNDVHNRGSGRRRLVGCGGIDRDQVGEVVFSWQCLIVLHSCGVYWLIAQDLLGKAAFICVCKLFDNIHLHSRKTTRNDGTNSLLSIFVPQGHQASERSHLNIFVPRVKL